MMSTVHGKVCPFCGVWTDGPHETQEGCIDALHREIARMRDLLDTVKPVSAGENTQGRSGMDNGGGRPAPPRTRG